MDYWKLTKGYSIRNWRETLINHENLRLYFRQGLQFYWLLETERRLLGRSMII